MDFPQKLVKLVEFTLEKKFPKSLKFFFGQKMRKFDERKSLVSIWQKIKKTLQKYLKHKEFLL